MVQSPCSSHLFNKVSYSAWLTQPRLKWPLSLVYTAHVGVSFGQTSILIWLSLSFSSLPSQEGHWIPSNTEEKKKCRETYREFNFGNRLRDKKKKKKPIDFPVLSLTNYRLRKWILSWTFSEQAYLIYSTKYAFSPKISMSIHSPSSSVYNERRLKKGKKNWLSND